MRRPSMLISLLVAVLAAATSHGQPEAALVREFEFLNAKIGDAPSQWHHARADVLFRLGRFEDAIRDYDAAAEFGEPHDDDSCWERGLAQYYAGDFEAGAEQFARYHRVGPLDIENGLWRFLCIAETDGIEKARETMLAYPRRVRPPFPALLALYLGEGDADAVVAEAAEDSAGGEDESRRMFNAYYYLSKYYEMVGERERALDHVQKALERPIPHFMYVCAEIDAKRLEADSAAEDGAEQDE